MVGELGEGGTRDAIVALGIIILITPSCLLTFVVVFVSVVAVSLERNGWKLTFSLVYITVREFNLAHLLVTLLR